ncbi:MAG: hypothetical protein KatS3mg085_448 [Candidatus Dojkabacteria bacterium]|nr:MAG: hypothetical protein KatS3mg085_448 [Candidatus Dojkabacteria bacterium]
MFVIQKILGKIFHNSINTFIFVFVVTFIFVSVFGSNISAQISNTCTIVNYINENDIDLFKDFSVCDVVVTNEENQLIDVTLPECTTIKDLQNNQFFYCPYRGGDAISLTETASSQEIRNDLESCKEKWRTGLLSFDGLPTITNFLQTDSDIEELVTFFQTNSVIEIANICSVNSETIVEAEDCPRIEGSFFMNDLVSQNTVELSLTDICLKKTGVTQIDILYSYDLSFNDFEKTENPQGILLARFTLDPSGSGKVLNLPLTSEININNSNHLIVWVKEDKSLNLKYSKPNSNNCQGIDCCAPGDFECRCLQSGGVWTAVGCIDPSPVGVLTRLVQLGLGIMGGVALIQIIYAGIMYQSGNEEKIRKAREQLLATLTGLAVLVFSVLIVQILGVNLLDTIPAGLL